MKQFDQMSKMMKMMQGPGGKPHENDGRNERRNAKRNARNEINKSQNRKS
jgi:hypothetical protein